MNGFQAFNAKMKEGRGFATIQSAANLDVLVVCQYVWGARPGHRDELVLRDRVTTPVTSQTSSEPPELDERLWSLMDYYDPTSAVNTDGEVVERYRFSAFGLRAVLDADFSPRTVSHYDWEFAFKGQFLDVDTGYYNYGYRYYSPELGRWLSRDPIGEEGGRYLYSMAENDPVNQIDYYGLFIDKLTRMYHCGKIIDKAKECADALANPDIVEACKEALSFVNDAGNLHEEFHQMVANHTESCWNEYTASGLSPYTGSLVVGGCAYDKAVDEFGEKYSSELAALDTCTCASACLALANSIRKCFSKNPAT